MKINIINTEFSFRKCFLPIKEVPKYALNGVVAIADYDNTFGHIPLQQLAKEHSFRPVFGVRLRVSRPENEKRRTGQVYTTFLAKDQEGLQALYRLVYQAYDQFYYFPRLYTRNLIDLHPGIINLGEDVPVNYYAEPKDRPIYQLLAGARKGKNDEYVHRFESRVAPMHITPYEYSDFNPEDFTAAIPQADMVKWMGSLDIRTLCVRGAKRKKIELDEEYSERLDYELNLIHEKGYEDYFMIVSDMVRWAKNNDILVGPSRGSSAGSLVCYLMSITEIDPVKHELIFERFIDVNRFDLPDIDIDFPDKDRGKVLDYLVQKYGRSRVRSLANVNRLMPKSAIGEFAQGLGIPRYETEEVKDAIIERSGGDARAAMCITDTFDDTEPGKKFIEKYPAMRLVERVEGHASHAGKHAAGIIVATLPLSTYAGANPRDDVLMMDKRDAEAIGLLKIDVLGLRTLSIIQDTISQIPGMTINDVYNLPLDDAKTFEIFNNMRLSGVFQFEGYALQSLSRQMGVDKFGDVVAITALARPGALNSGGASRFVKYRNGTEDPVYINDVHERITGDTYGITVFQEQMMEIAREIGHLSWADVSTLRKAASKSLGDEFFGKWKNKFIDGAMEGSELDRDSAEALWNDISHSGSWSFNKSHAVSYGLISYWTAYFKANYPLEFAVGSLRNARDSDHALKLLRDMVKFDNIQFRPIDAKRSVETWSVQDGVLVGGLTNIKGVGMAKAKKFIKMREGKIPITPEFWKKLEDPVTDFDVLFPTDHYWGMFWYDPISTGLVDSKPSRIEEIDEEGTYTFIGRLVDRNMRDLNEYVFLKDRGGERIEENNLYLNMTVEDDTDSIVCTINRYLYEQFGREIAESGKVGEDWYLIEGKIRGDWRKIQVDAILNLNDWRAKYVKTKA